jgi:thiamine-phosphate pyrophosphorylase
MTLPALYAIPGLYAILDAESCARRGFALTAVAEAWRDAGVRLVQYRDKQATDAAYVANAAVVKAVFEGSGAMLLLNDRVDLVGETGWDGVHLGQGDLSPSSARAVLGAGKILGLSTHTALQVRVADGDDVDYIAVGPVFGTVTKLDAEPVVGVEGVVAARAVTRKPLVAIGGITLERVPQVVRAGADSVALISALLPPAGAGQKALRKSAQDFLAVFK